MFTNETIASQKPFKIVNLRCNIPLIEVNDQHNYGFDANTDPDYSNYPLIVASKAAVNTDSLLLSWDLLDPNTNQIYQFKDSNFSNFTVELLDYNNQIVSLLTDTLVNTNYVFDTSSLKNLAILSYNDVNYLRDCRIRITSYTNDGKISQAVYIFTFPIASFSNVNTSISNGIFINYSITEKDYLKSVSLESYFDSSFGNLYDSSTSDVSSNIFINNNGVDKLFYRLNCQDYYNTGQPYIIGQIKINNIDSQTYEEKPVNLTGAISVIYDSDLKVFDKKLFVKWSPPYTNSPLNYEVHATRSGNANISDIYYLNAPKIENISYITQGTGDNILAYTQKNINPYYSGANFEPIFKASGESGIQWKEHTIVLDNKGKFPSGLYFQDTIEDIFSITLPSGSLNSRKLYLTYFYDSELNSFITYQSEATGATGQTGTTGVVNSNNTNSTIIGSYSSDYYGNTISEVQSGINYFSNKTGILIAQRFDFASPSTSLVVCDIEPYYFIPIDIVTDYEVEVRGIINEDIYTDYSDSCQFTATGIQYAITGIKDLNLIEGTGVSGYLAKFNGRDSITTGTLYYDASNNLNFSELPVSTTTATDFR